jgi:hypothetical protein
VYDFISVDGRARVHCLKRALPLLKPEGGILMLVRACCSTKCCQLLCQSCCCRRHTWHHLLRHLQDNSEREWYADAFAAVPEHWLKFEDHVNTGELRPSSSYQATL